MIEYFKKTDIFTNVKFKLDLSNYSTKSDLKDAVVDTSYLT